MSRSSLVALSILIECNLKSQLSLWPDFHDFHVICSRSNSQITAVISLRIEFEITDGRTFPWRDHQHGSGCYILDHGMSGWSLYTLPPSTGHAITAIIVRY
ncbi:hypothetical protein BD410DRAFT_461834 [Rickenella mellea]|uniref:Uncharacterized protein n=1 Tax=Rickenella mellea TaxID=50990 RepID=A0A4Y7PTW4_9AGAM|nr:hypothetical protein BD410DRAFT_461834 [Rickenella mellea]